MKPSTELFDLIQSLTKSEKRFFRLSSSIQSGEKNYFKLFDFIEQQVVYDESALKKHFKGERFIKHLPSEKNYLYRLILKSLRQFYGDLTVTNSLHQSLKDIEILYNKTLYKEATKFLKRAKKLAHENEAFYLLTDLLTWEKTLTEESYESGNFDVDLSEIIQEEEAVIEKLRNLAAYHILYSRINALFRSDGFSKNEEQRKKVKEIAEHPLIKGKNTALSSRAASICYYIQGLCAATNRDFDTSYQKFNRVKIILDRKPKIRADLSQRYVLTLSHFIQCYVSECNFDKAQGIIGVIRNLKGKEGFKSIQINLRINNILLTEQIKVYNLQGKFKDAVAVYEKEFEKNKILINRSSKENRIKFHFSVAYSFFGVGAYKESLNFINDILNDNEQKLRQDLYSFARILNVLVHFEMKNYDYIDYLVAAALRYLNKVKRDHQIEYVFIKELKVLAKNYRQFGVENQLKLLNKSNKKIDALFSIEHERVILDYIDVRAWFDSKINSISFSESIQNNLYLPPISNG